MARKADPTAAHLPPPYTAITVRALQALQAGEADEVQQQHALDWIIRLAAGTYDLPYRPGGPEGDRASTFAAGKMFVGQQIVKLTNLTPQQIRKLEG